MSQFIFNDDECRIFEILLDLLSYIIFFTTIVVKGIVIIVPSRGVRQEVSKFVSSYSIVPF